MDLTKQKRRKRRLTVLNRVLRHNLRNDTGKIMGYADLIKERTEDTQLAAHATDIHDIATGLSEIADHTRQLQEVIDTNVPVDATVDLANLLPPVVDELDTEYPEAEIGLTTPECCRVHGTDDLSLAVAKVVENAIEHNEPPQNVDVTVRDNGDKATIQVRDNGPGIPDQESRIISDEKEITDLRHASGLGLWVVKWVLNLCDGDIEIVNLSPRGSVVKLILQSA